MMTHAAPSWAFYLKTNMQHLQAVHNWALGLIGEYGLYIRIDKLHLNLKIMKTKNFM